MRALIAGILAMIVSPTLGHDAPTGWPYPRDCCNNQDCAPIRDDRVEEVQGGYSVDGRIFVPHERVRPSPDGDYHGCFTSSNAEYPARIRKLESPDEPACFWAPQGGV